MQHHPHSNAVSYKPVFAVLSHLQSLPIKHSTQQTKASIWRKYANIHANTNAESNTGLTSNA